MKEFKDALAQMREGRQRADETVQPWQSRLAVGDYFVKLDQRSGLTIYGEILNPVAKLPPDPTPEEQFEHDGERDLWASRSMRNVRFARCYSEVVPDGEVGNIHVSTVALKLQPVDFQAAMLDGWPNLLPH